MRLSFKLQGQTTAYVSLTRLFKHFVCLAESYLKLTCGIIL